MPNKSEILEPNNPANKTVEPTGNRRVRIPMSVPLRRLEVPEIDGYHCHWIKESNIPRALQAFYEFVNDHEVPINQRGIATDTEMSGSTDLGSRVSISAGIGADNRPERLYLMKLALQYWDEDRQKIDERNAQKLQGIFRGEVILDKGEVDDKTKELRYVNHEHTKALFNRRRAKQ
jgi:hypothetical protein